MFFPDPSEVIYKLSRYANKYPPNKYCKDAAFAHVTVIPNLFDYVDHLGDLPTPDVLYNHIMTTYCDKRYWNEKNKDTYAEWRGVKLVLDFYREMHTYGLLIQSGLFGFVKYGKALDINLNVDFLVRILSYLVAMVHKNPKAGIQAMMRSKHQWSTGDKWSLIKAERRARRTQGVVQFEGDIYYLTNKDIPFDKNVNGVWLFGLQHVKQLREQILDEKPIEAGIQEILLN